MKYIITEARLNDIIEKYLSSELSDLKLVERNEDTDWYVNQSGHPLVIKKRHLRQLGKHVWIRHN